MRGRRPIPRWPPSSARLMPITPTLPSTASAPGRAADVPARARPSAAWRRGPSPRSSCVPAMAWRCWPTSNRCSASRPRWIGERVRLKDVESNIVRCPTPAAAQRMIRLIEKVRRAGRHRGRNCRGRRARRARRAGANRCSTGSKPTSPRPCSACPPPRDSRSGPDSAASC